MTTIETPSGRLVGRALDPEAGHPRVLAFTGVPYARPPIGPLRLRPPVAIGPWATPLDATSVPARSVQPPSMLAPAGEPEGEDCLALNVWTADPEGSAPVMVWFHGGSFVTGSGSISWYRGARLAERGVVVVTVNYRLGPLGFLHLADLGGDEWAGCTNVGLQDQALALRWVSDHIASFGGDPGRVTIFGESAGAMSVSAHLAVPGSAGLFRRAIAQSGAAGHVQDRERGDAVARATLAGLGIGVRELHRLAELPADAFRDATAAVVSADPDRDVPLPFRPTVDGSVLPVAPLSALVSGAAAGIELLTGTTRDEMNLFRLMSLLDGAAADLDRARLERRVARALEARGRGAVDASTVVEAYRSHLPEAATNADVWASVATDLTFRLPMVAMLDAHTGAGGEAWSYRFDHASTAFGGSLGAAHAVEIPFVFDNVHQSGTEAMLGAIDDDRRRFAAQLADRWTAFAAADDLGAAMTVPGSPRAWPRYEPATRTQAVLDLSSELVDDLGGDARRLWSGATA